MPESELLAIFSPIAAKLRRNRVKVPVKILMPALSPTMTEGKIAQWLVAENDTVASGIFSPRLKPIKRLWKSKPLMMAPSAKSSSKQAPTKLTSIAPLPCCSPMAKMKAPLMRPCLMPNSRPRWKRPLLKRRRKTPSFPFAHSHTRPPPKTRTRCTTRNGFPDGTNFAIFRCAKPCATPWRKKCGAMVMCLSWAKKWQNMRAHIR